MRFLIISHVPHKEIDGKYFAYAPYVNEMNIWLQYTDEVVVVAPLSTEPVTAIEECYTHQNIRLVTVPEFNLLGWKAVLKALLVIPKIIVCLYGEMKKTDHIHLRCPGNMGLLGCWVQLAFPSKKKTAKYAGNWDPESQQPLTYKLQRWMLSQEVLTRNIRVLVYGAWPDATKNIQPFFTATYHHDEIRPLAPSSIDAAFRFVFLGGLVPGKRPDYAVKLVHALHKLGKDVRLDLYGDGALLPGLEQYIAENQLASTITLHGNQARETVKSALMVSHFVILPSASEGWPKAIAEGMFWGCVPLATPVSCVPSMLDNGKRGLLLSMDVDTDSRKVCALMEDGTFFNQMRKEAAKWSRQHTLDTFDAEIRKLMHT